MNVAYPKWMKPPKELFSRQWGYIVWGDNNSRPPLYGRIDETKKKLEDLETKLRKKIWKDNRYVEDLLIDTITLINTYIGVWESTKFITPSNLPHHITMIYPHISRVMSKWEEVILGGVQREGVCLCMLSPEAVQWLNKVSNWVGE